MNIETDLPIEPELLAELGVFENFLSRFGFKRIDGSIFGLLFLSMRPISSEEIQSILEISQSAVSQSIKQLDMYGAVETVEQRGTRTKRYKAKDDCLAIVASVFRKRELQHIEELHLMAKRVLKEREKENRGSRSRRLESMLLATELGESMINFLIHITSYGDNDSYKKISKRFKDMLSFLADSKDSTLPHAIATNIAGRIKDGLLKFTGEIR
ncbi:MAG: HTH domain-containing protein [Bacteriovoracaceae bacterium]|nr:HTH domain-containing protein [Bacteriovoracaceae bacterium]